MATSSLESNLEADDPKALSVSPPPPSPSVTMQSQGEATMKETPKKRSLLDLPSRIWSKIGHFVIDASPDYTRSQILNTHRRSGTGRRYQPAITHTCRALRQELLEYFFATKCHIVFDFKSKYTGVVAAVRAWLQAMSLETRRLVTMSICMSSKPEMQLAHLAQLRASWRQMPFRMVDEAGFNGSLGLEFV
ncbi:hypothetical protein CLAFUW4_12889 [Fulvia fulva]|uniref:Uncharacterized protein n=1 Tax=Passalora fulva TaxID=5499 RepID=A0A9Q8PK20_PASFU|nr:uncharacterized protein CLAFUR5_12755 [Fulvia fulva]KAK4612238.1 hypothetical protein CLAFUR4_12893 [Fulvia fulva]KAK4612759.1 hypothetical protein CLAFUR0_12899 [Fulvia fulva]UJO23961.1 hypothetical protein CLAFUR5_12755 [Fulvia fulva]WPV20911.1 hypothetical protein CLAFUW4_12889 [Fulvia fulva]WPV36528.1 hypothetical protein CLAFUW7_12896 [Fulvia fulva]